MGEIFGKHREILHFALYDAHIFAQIFEGKIQMHFIPG